MDFMDYINSINLMNLSLSLMDEEDRLNGKKKQNNNDIFFGNFFGFESPYYDEDDEDYE